MKSAVIATVLMAFCGTAMAQDAGSWTSSLSPNGWSIVAGESEDQLEYYRAPRRMPNGHLLMWTRSEFRQPPVSDVLSGVELSEYDCAQGSYLVIQQTFYDARNLRGASRDGTLSGKWEYPIPNTVGDVELKLACEAARRLPAHRQRGSGS
jgi:hypothetical protein